MCGTSTLLSLQVIHGKAHFKTTHGKVTAANTQHSGLSVVHAALARTAGWKPL